MAATSSTNQKWRHMQEAPIIKVLVADPQPIVRKGVVTILQNCADFEIVGQAACGENTLVIFEQYHPDVVTLDIDLPGYVSGIEVINAMVRNSTHTRVIVLTNRLEEMVIHEALKEGAISYLIKNIGSEDLVQAVRAAYQGIPTLSPEVTPILIHEAISPSQIEYNLTPREYQVLNLLAQGRNNNLIAEELHISLSTVQFHVSNILTKLDVNNRIEAATFAVRHQITSASLEPGIYH